MLEDFIDPVPPEEGELPKLKEMLEEANIPYDTSVNFFGGEVILYFGKNGRPENKEGASGAVCSVIYGYGSDMGLIEISGLLTKEELEEDSVAGYLTAEDVFNRIKNHWNNE